MKSTLARRVAPALLGAALALLGCRDDVSPFESEDTRADSITGGQLTFSPKDDRVPAWSLAGDSVYYTTEGGGHLPDAPGVLVGLPVSGGVARPILSNVQLPNELGLTRWLVAPDPDPTGGRLAFAEIASLWEPNPCPGTGLSCDPPLAEAPLPPLRQVFIRVRRFDAINPLEEDTALTVTAPGVVTDSVVIPPVSFFTPRFTVRFHPFQRLFERERAFSFRPSWAPDGQRLAYSDGLRILIWTVGQGDPVAVPGSEDGLWPAWSPDGETLAFTRVERADPANSLCVYVALGPCAVVDYTVFTPGRRALRRIHPDGSGLIDLGEGEEPAWSPDGGTLFFRRGNAIWRVAPDGSSAEPVPGTDGGREPAVSPDGRFLAFARLSEDGDYDIWVVSLDQ